MNTHKEKKLIFACRWDKIPEKSWSGSAYAVYKELEKRYTIERFDIKDNLRVKLFKLFRKMNFVHGEPSLFSMVKENNRKLKKRIGTEKVKVFQFSEFPWTQNTENYIYQDLSIEYILYMKKNYPQDYLYSGFNNIDIAELQKRAECQKEFYQQCAGIFTMGKWLADFLVNDCKISKTKVHVVGAGMNVSGENIDYSSKEGNKILFVGKDFKRKGGEIVIQAFRVLREQYMNNAELYIVGPMDNPLHNDEAGITYVGNVGKTEVAKYYNMCDVFCMPSYFEAYGIVFCEALAYGLPCIARNKYAMAEIIKDGEEGYLIENDDVQILAKKMHDLLTNEVIKKTVQERCEEYIQKYSWENIVEQMDSVMTNRVK